MNRIKALTNASSLHGHLQKLDFIQASHIGESTSGRKPLFYNICIDVAFYRNYLNKNNEIIFSREAYLEGNAIAIGATALVVEYVLDNIKIN